MLGRVSLPWWGWTLAAGCAWLAAAIAAGIVLGRAIHAADRDTFVPQLDDPLRRGTDLDPEFADWRSTVAAEPSLAGAIMALGFATDETTARYWLAVCARRGADWDLQRQLWDAWLAQRAADVTYLNTDTDPEDDRP
jgi:hypothetical protein